MTLLCTLLVTAGLLLAMEVYLRLRGNQTAVLDDKKLWASCRRQAAASDPHLVVFMGSSRMQLGLAPESWRSVFPDHKTVQLAFDNGTPALVLEDLADETQFRGTVVCDVRVSGVGPPSVEPRALEFVEYYHKRWSIKDRVNCYLRTVLQDTFVVLSPELDWMGALKDLLHGRMPQMKPVFLRTRPDRTRQADYTLADVEKMRKKWAIMDFQSPCGEELKRNGEWSQGIQRLQRATRRIMDRGGRVIFVRFPSSGELRYLEEKCFPKAAFWDELARSVGAPAIHFLEVPSLSGFTCPEESHLDRRDTGPFTRALAQEIKRRRLL